VGIAARGAASSVADALAALEANASHQETRAPIRLTRRTHRRPFHRPAPAKDDLDDDLNNGFGDHHWYGSDIGGSGKQRQRLLL
jgi:hypothetical protein